MELQEFNITVYEPEKLFEFGLALKTAVKDYDVFIPTIKQYGFKNGDSEIVIDNVLQLDAWVMHNWFDWHGISASIVDQKTGVPYRE